MFRPKTAEAILAGFGVWPGKAKAPMDAKATFLKHVLEEGTDLYALVGTKVRPRRLPTGFKNEYAAIVFFRSGGVRDLDLTMDEPVFTCRCYGGTVYESDAEAVADALEERVHGKYSYTNEKGRIVRARVTSRFDWEDPDIERCPVVVVIVEMSVE